MQVGSEIIVKDKLSFHYGFKGVVLNDPPLVFKYPVKVALVGWPKPVYFNRDELEVIDNAY